MKCAICGRKTNWDESYGYRNFIVCPCCYNLLKETLKDDSFTTLEIIFALGEARKRGKKK